MNTYLIQLVNESGQCEKRLVCAKTGQLARRKVSAHRVRSCKLLPKFMADCLINHEQFGRHYGWFKDTSGNDRVEQINPRALYGYIFRTDHPETSVFSFLV